MSEQEKLPKKTSRDWAHSLVNLTIVDYDGWDRSNLDYSFNQELITFSDFIDRLNESTVRIGEK